MTLIPKDMTSVYKGTTDATRWQRAVYADHLPPCNNACPAGLNIEAWLYSRRRASTRMPGANTWKRIRFRRHMGALAIILAKAPAIDSSSINPCHRRSRGKRAGGLRRGIVAIGTQLATRLNIPAIYGGKMIDAISLLEQVEKAARPCLAASLVLPAAAILRWMLPALPSALGRRKRFSSSASTRHIWKLILMRR